MSGWVVRASGNSEDPADHKHLLEELTEVFRKHRHGTGSSEFSSPHVLASNFHESDDSGSGDAATPAGSGNGRSGKRGKQGSANPAT